MRDAAFLSIVTAATYLVASATADGGRGAVLVTAWIALGVLAERDRPQPNRRDEHLASGAPASPSRATPSPAHAPRS